MRGRLAVSLFKRQCSWPGCEVSGKPSSYASRGFVAGECSRHGSWVGCEKHSSGYGYRGIYDPPTCPLCTWERPETQDPLEAGRRNAGEDAARQRSLSGYAAEFRAQGYGEVAAQAMANKRLREEGPPPRNWRSEDIEFERKRAELQRKIDAGKVMRCPSCKAYVPVSEGVILKHNTEVNYGGGDRSIVPCEGEGMLAERSSS
jgi:hypothetical protein